YAVLRPGDAGVAALGAAPLLELLVRHGHLGVDLFFLLSGFLRGLPWLLRERARAPAPSTRAFYLRRIRRLAPAFYVQLAVLFLVVAPLARGWDYGLRDPLGVGLNLGAHVAFLHHLLPLSSGSLGLNGALWSLGVEANFYLLLPLLAPLAARRPLAATVAAFAIAAWWRAGAREGFEPLVAATMALGSHWSWPEPVVRHVLATQLPAYLGHFALGMLLGHGWLAWRARGFALARPLAFAGGVLSLAAIAALLAHAPDAGGQLWLVLCAALGVALLSAAAARGAIAAHLLAAGPLAFLGRISYSAYLYHLPVLVLWNLYLPAHAATLPLYLGIVVTVSWLSWRFVETNHWGRTPIKFLRGSRRITEIGV
ncbi:MAG TPA: acyltransferase, partial [Myxococcota bacterium]|nr:acyltransferase [Myxococcota bacterium]